MNKQFFEISFRVVFVVLLAVTFSCLYAENVKATSEKMEYIEIEEETVDGMVTKKIPAVEAPCELKGNAKEEANKYVEMGKKNNWNFTNKISKAKTIIKEINAKKFDDLGHLSTMVELSLYNWACKNEYKLHNTNNQGIYFFKKDKSQGIFIGLGSDGALRKEGVGKGYANLETERFDRWNNPISFQVVITKLPYDPNEKSSNELHGEAQEILDDIVNFSYEWGLNYYTTFIDEAAKKK
ncbi:MAG: hypothetical protein J7L25_00330 [Deltaproteobacteria bacterium]|nr:hypothetical protein [Candidatus Tharpella aukensis]